MTLAWLFPGQGTQAAGMGRDLYESSPAGRLVLDQADDALEFPLTRLLFGGPAEELQLTINAQPAIVAVSLAALAAYREAAGDEPVPAPAYVAGHSVGEYAALVAAGAADGVTALRLVRARAEAMHAAGQERPGSMVAVLGLGRTVVEEACRQARAQVTGSYVCVATHNEETQVTIAGDREGLEVASELCRQAGARRCVPLAVSAAFHSAAMKPAAEALAGAVAAASIGDAVVPLVANVTGQPIQSAAEIRQELTAQIARPVLWADSMRTMAARGVACFVELGTGQVLTNVAQRMGLDAIAAGDTASVTAAVAWVRERQA